jgi:hypothetical protein
MAAATIIMLHIYGYQQGHGSARLLPVATRSPKVTDLVACEYRRVLHVWTIFLSEGKSLATTR